MLSDPSIVVVYPSNLRSHDVLPFEMRSKANQRSGSYALTLFQRSPPLLQRSAERGNAPINCHPPADLSYADGTNDAAFPSTPE
jgi:hypothetical protein